MLVCVCVCLCACVCVCVCVRKCVVVIFSVCVGKFVQFLDFVYRLLTILRVSLIVQIEYVCV